VDKDDRLRLVAVTPGRDTGATIEILSGLEPGQKIIANPTDSIIDGQKVRVVQGNQATPARQESRP